ncbi:molybdenum cofactor biosynthesis protein MoeA [Sphingomonas sp. Leaf407]|uniref:molybdopterin molybdotransferase MoeA n=1 Tax=unclassified Sphingomonas TaxID=196159 RepID=UPI0006FBCB54|nr:MULTISPECIES: molybdopterin molybdotransferase MoeA [unclassified Sphingomonas]KQN37659.1 molybdenum cofactor biosynthesis protein MoeA [Sphingomonas sp. Leaf42]KQT28026.1 molybdenum cofactor biosynthesis protein MoeA [Sphingomonas sp. Leaf407]
MTLLPVADAQTRVLALGRAVRPETLPIADTIGRYAAADIVALRTQPARPLSAMDGYAIRFDDLPGPWDVIGESAAGASFPGTVTPGQATRIFTGAAMPAGTDCVLVQEEAAREGDRLTLAGEGPVRGGNVRRAGLDFREGEVLIAAGERITPTRAALAAIGGHGTLPVGRRVRVAIAATGDELVPAGSAIGPDQLPETNGLMLAGLLADLPVDRIDLGILPDRMDALEAAFRAVDCDLLVTTGGASVGDHDLVKPALIAAGGSLDFWRIALRPGKPMLAGRRGDAAVLGLPGNPVSACITAILFVRPLVARIAGAADPLPRPIAATLAHPLPANGPRQDYLRATLIGGTVSTAAIQDSSMLRTLARSDCLIIRAPHAPAAMAGDSAEILQLA